MANPLFAVQQLPQTSADAVREFNDRYLASMIATPVPTWSDIGDMIPTSSTWVTFPMTNLALKYQETMGESRRKRLKEKSFDIKSVEFDEGIEGRLSDMLQHAFAYRQWTSGPAMLLEAEKRLRNLQLAALIENGQNTLWGSGTGIDGQNFFSAAHLADFFDAAKGTWSNYQTTAKDCVSIVNLQAEVTAMQGVLDANGMKMGIEPDTILVPTPKYEATKNLLAQALILDNAGVGAAVTNPYLGRFNVIHVPEFTDVNDWYLVDSKKLAQSGMAPWIALRSALLSDSQLGLRIYDESSDYFKDTGNLKISSHIWYGFALGFPHCIRKIVGV